MLAIGTHDLVYLLLVNTNVQQCIINHNKQCTILSPVSENNLRVTHKVIFQKNILCPGSACTSSAMDSLYFNFALLKFLTARPRNLDATSNTVFLVRQCPIFPETKKKHCMIHAVEELTFQPLLVWWLIEVCMSFHPWWRYIACWKNTSWHTVLPVQTELKMSWLRNGYFVNPNQTLPWFMTDCVNCWCQYWWRLHLQEQISNENYFFMFL